MLAAAPNVDPQANALLAANAPAADPNAPDSAPNVAAAPVRQWQNDAGEVVATGQFVGLLDGGAVIRKTVGGIAIIPLADLSMDDRQYATETYAMKLAQPATLAQN